MSMAPTKVDVQTLKFRVGSLWSWGCFDTFRDSAHLIYPPSKVPRVPSRKRPCFGRQLHTVPNGPKDPVMAMSFEMKDDQC